MRNKKITYMDNAATTPMSMEVLNAMMPYLTVNYGNASALYSLGEDSKRAIDDARAVIASTINAEPDEIFFTSGGSEANNWVIRSLDHSRSITTTEIEHHSLLNSCEAIKHSVLHKNYVKVGVNQFGCVSIEDIGENIYANTQLISVMFANNEIGTIQPVKDIGRICKEQEVLFHVDAVQAYGHEHIDVKDMNIDLMSASGHKFNGPKGVGFLYCRRDKQSYLKNLISGGGQEKGLRSGTENVANIVGMAKAAEISCSSIDENNRYLYDLRFDFESSLICAFHDCSINGGIGNRKLANNINVTIPGISSEAAVILLSEAGICCSAGSACNSNSKEVSHVLKAIGLSDDEASSTLRFTIGRDTTHEDIEYVVDRLKDIRNMYGE